MSIVSVFHKAAVFAVFACTTAFGQAMLETDHLRLEISADARLESLTSKPSGEQYASTDAPGPIASIERQGKVIPATAASLEGDCLNIRFRDQATAHYRLNRQKAYLGFELTALEGPPVDVIHLLQLRIRRLPQLGTWINVAYDDHFGICLCTGNPRTDASLRAGSASEGVLRQQTPWIELAARTEKSVGLEGAVAILFGCRDPKEHFLDQMEIIERDYRLPAGARRRRSPLQRLSYLSCAPTPSNVDQYIELARRAGLRMMYVSYMSFTQGAGHFKIKPEFPNGIEDVKRMMDRIRAAGLKLALHIHYNKAVKTDAYVTPVPDDRLHLVRRFTLAGPLDESATTLTVSENPTGCTRDEGRRILKVGKELISYRDYTTAAPFEFTGCQRGHLKTRIAAHPAAEPLGLLDVDDWPIFIRFDQRTDIQDEAAARLAEIYSRTGPYDMVYFDGAEDVHEPKWFNVSNAQYRVYCRLIPEPVVCETANMSHFSWHMMSRSNAYDVPAEWAKSFCHEISCRAAPVRAVDFTRINFGWLLGFSAKTGPDTIEYMVSRGAAWDCPFSAYLDLKTLARNPRGEDCLEVIKTWENARLAGQLTDEHRRMLKTLDPREYQFVDVWDARLSAQWMRRWQKADFQDREHHLFLNEQGQYELAPIDAIGNLPDARLKACILRREKALPDTYLLLWTTDIDGTLRLPISSDRVEVARPLGKALPIRSDSGQTSIEVGSRRYLRLRATSARESIELLQKSEFSK